MNQIFKQAWHQAKTNPVYTSLYIAGVTLTILFVMVIGMVLYVKLAPVYPEKDRYNTLYISQHRIDFEGGAYISSVGMGAYDKLYSKLQNCKDKAMVTNYLAKVAIKDPVGGITLNGQKKKVSKGFWDIYNFEFLAGQKLPESTYNEENPRNVIITEKLAERLFGSAEEAVGKALTVGEDYPESENEYNISGVVRSGSYLCSNSYSDVYIPIGRYMVDPQKDEKEDMTGDYQFVVTTTGPRQTKLLEQEITDMLKRSNTSRENKEGEDKWTMNIGKQPTSHWETVLAPDNMGGDLKKVIWMLVVILLALLVVPAINLSGLIGGRMDTRLSELGIRKSYGATKWSLLKQVLFENFLLTSAGALLGMIGAWIIIKSCRRWIFSIFDPSPTPIPDWAVVDVNSDMMFAPMLFLILLVVCFAVNLLSAFFPAWAYMRKPIVTSLYEKR